MFWMLALFHWRMTKDAKASELVPSSLFPCWNSMRFFARGSRYDTSSPGGSNNILTCTSLWSRTCCHCEIPKKLILNRTKPAKNTPLFLFPYMRHSLKLFPWEMPLHAHVFSFTHNAVVLWLFRCVHPKIQTKIFNFDIFMNQNKCRLYKTWSDR